MNAPTTRQMPRPVPHFVQFQEFVMHEVTLKSLRQKQREALEATIGFFERSNKGQPAVIVMPTGTGKSGVIACLPYALGATRALILTPSNEIRLQIAADWGHKTPLDQSFFVRRGLVTEDEARTVLPVCVVLDKASELNSSVLTSTLLIGNAHKFSPRCTHQGEWKRKLTSRLFDLIIVDEAHHLPADTWTNVTNHFSQSKLVFLTATPKRADGTRITNSVGEDDYAYTYSREQAVRDGVIRDVVLHELRDEDEDDTDEGEGEGEDDNDEAKAQKAAYTAIVQKVKRLLAAKNVRLGFPTGDKHKALLITATVQECHAVSEVCKSLGLQATVYHSHRKRYRLTRRRAGENKDAFEGGTFDVLIVVQSLLEGYDHPPISVLGIATRITSAVKFQQFIGRGLRVVQGENDGRSQRIVADVVTHERFSQRHLFEKYRNGEVAETDNEDPEEWEDSVGEDEEDGEEDSEEEEDDEDEEEDGEDEEMSE